MSGIKKRDPASIVHMGSQTQLTGLDQIYLTVLSYRCSSVRRSPGADIICMPAKNRSLNKERCYAKKKTGYLPERPPVLSVQPFHSLYKKAPRRAFNLESSDPSKTP